MNFIHTSHFSSSKKEWTAECRNIDYLNSEYIYLRKESVKKELIKNVENTFYNVLAKQDSFMKAF